MLVLVVVLWLLAAVGFLIVLDAVPEPVFYAILKRGKPKRMDAFGFLLMFWPALVVVAVISEVFRWVNK